MLMPKPQNSFSPGAVFFRIFEKTTVWRAGEWVHFSHVTEECHRPLARSKLSCRVSNHYSNYIYIYIIIEIWHGCGEQSFFHLTPVISPFTANLWFRWCHNCSSKLHHLDEAPVPHIAAWDQVQAPPSRFSLMFATLWISAQIQWIIQATTVDGCEILHQLIDVLSHDL